MSGPARAATAGRKTGGERQGKGEGQMSATKKTGGAARGEGIPDGIGLLGRPPGPGRIAAYAVLLVLGAIVGAAGALVQPGLFPGGLLLALAGCAGLFLGGGRATGSRGGVLAGAAGWLIAVVLLTTSRPEGDFVFGAGFGSYLFLLGGLAVAVMCATLGQPSQRGGGTS